MPLPGHRLWLSLLVLSAGFVLLALRENSLSSHGNLRATVFDVPGAATILQTASGGTLLIGGGRDMALFEEMGTALPFTLRTIDLLVLADAKATSPAQIARITRRYRVRAALLPAGPPEALQPLRDILTQRGIRIIEVAWGKAMTFDRGVRITLEEKGATKTPLVRLATGGSSIDLPGTTDDLPSAVRPSFLRAVIRQTGAAPLVLIADKDAVTDGSGLALYNLAAKGSLSLSLP